MSDGIKFDIDIELVDINLDIEMTRLLEETCEQIEKDIKNSALRYGWSSEYASGWKHKINENKATIYSTGKTLKLAHLLEFGHKTRNKATSTRPFPHIESASTKGINDFHQKTNQAIKASIGNMKVRKEKV